MSLFVLARRFVAGEEVGPAIRAVRELNQSGMSASLNLLGEHVSTKEDVLRSTAEYLRLFDCIAESGVEANVSLKLTQLGLDIDPNLCYDQVSGILEHPSSVGNFLRLDMEGTPYTQRTLDMFFRLFGGHQNVGVVIQAYLHRSEADIRQLNQARARVRLCKGAYKEPPEMAIQRIPEIRARFLELAGSLLADGAFSGFATHDDELIGGVKTLVREDHAEREKFEFQMLYGIRTATQAGLVREGYKLRVYVPYGTQWAPYFYRRLRERKENIWFVARNLFKD
ncbi:MAG: proline dehydrogenase family protein [Acidobacteria bacterium]|nr:proline dehydrogenase family protein [Acidobacteriota bacterium]